MIIRNAVPADAEKLAGLIADAESSGFMMFDPGERQLSAEGLSKRIRAVENAENSTILLAEDNTELKGYLFVIGNEPTRTRHSVYLAIGIREDSRGQGVGTKLFETMESWARARSMRRLELTVMMNNRGGIALYQKAGFSIEGIKKNSLKVDGEYIDEYYMAKLFSS
ncbi:GNAT family N-acetyltransferase [Planococcus sp. CAU13]|uniref:GNAT family N-acetyltransferase n=1 Tax=Planococcus sp. CAU13 TaxID=1541197 RepID=UPI00052FDDA0|nr:GNAT family N-acetyltransferase [Planococcus sp. CAU13]